MDKATYHFCCQWNKMKKKSSQCSPYTFNFPSFTSYLCSSRLNAAQRRGNRIPLPLPRQRSRLLVSSNSSSSPCSSAEHFAVALRSTKRPLKIQTCRSSPPTARVLCAYVSFYLSAWKTMSRRSKEESTGCRSRDISPTR